MTIQTDVQSAAPGVLVELLDVDATSLGGDVAHIVSKATAPVTWRGEVYVPVDFTAEGFESGSTGSLARPKVRVDNARNALLAMVLQCNDLTGARVTRWKTLSKYLDGQAQADPEAWLRRDVYYVERKTEQTRQSIEFELSCLMDLEGMVLPARQVLRDWCPRSYRRFDAASQAFAYASPDRACPYQGEACFDREGNICSEALDACGKRRSDCALRFGKAALPTWSFYGVAVNRS